MIFNQQCMSNSIKCHDDDEVDEDDNDIKSKQCMSNSTKCHDNIDGDDEGGEDDDDIKSKQCMSNSIKSGQRWEDYKNHPTKAHGTSRLW